MSLEERIVDWLITYSQSNNNKCFIVGVSGGIDSALVSTLCALTKITTHVVNLPIHQNKNEILLANQHIEWLNNNFENIVSHRIDLSDVYNSIKNKFEKYDSKLGFANTKSRLRMISLYQLSTYFDGLVVGTGNKIEDFGIGFFTKYGDGGVDIAPIADLTKSEVKYLSKSIGISEKIISANPTDGLWEDNRTDEEQIGATYEELELVMNYTGNIEELPIRLRKVYDIYTKLNKKNKHKMVPIPIFKNKK